MARCVIFLVSLMFSMSAFSQQFKGRVLDSLSQKPLPFATVVFDGDNTRGVTTNLNGEFSVVSKGKDEMLVVSYVGYASRKMPLSSLSANGDVSLVPLAYNINEVLIYPSENPAHRIINNAIAAIDANNPEKMKAYSCRIYNRTMIKGEPTKVDNVKRRFNNKLDSMNFMMIESVVDRNYKSPDITKETIVANRVSGLKEPPFSFLATTFQPFHFYQPNIELIDKKFLNPISSNSTRNYFFQLQDTLVDARGDSTFIIKFTPRRGTNFDGLKGFLHISSNGWAIRNVVAERASDENLSIRIEQQYSFNKGHWFPQEYRYSLMLRNYPPGLGLDFTYEGTGTVYDVAYFIPERISRSSLTIADSANSSYSYIEKYRSSPLTKKDSTTYREIDSLGRVEHIDRTLTCVPILMRGNLPLGFLSLPITSLWATNKYEGNRFGVGLETNSRLSRYVEFGGYYAYGTKDKTDKYGGVFRYYPMGNLRSKIELSYRNDVMRPTQNFLVGERMSKIANRFLLEKADRVLSYEALAKFRVWDIDVSLSGKRMQFAPQFSYQYNGVEQYKLWSTVSEATLNLRLGWKERETKFFDTYFYASQNYPVVGLKLRQGFDVFGGKYSYTGIEGGAFKKFELRNAGDLRVTGLGGWLSGDVPYSLVYGANSTNSWYFSFLVDNSFACAKPFEYASNKYGSLFVYYDLKSLLFSSKRFKPMVSLFQAAGWSKLDNASHYQNLDVRDMHDGYFESGLVLSNILRKRYLNIVYVGVGAGAFVAYGDAVDKPLDKTLTVKATLSFDF